jgi:predicted MPP superfamily phosphohydrolase
MADRFTLAFWILVVQALEAFILIKGLKIPARWVPLVIAAFVVFNLPLPYVLWLQAGARQPSVLLAAAVVRPFFAWHFNWLTFLVSLAPLIVIVRAGAWYFDSEAAVSALRWAILLVAGSWGALTVMGLVNTVRPPQVKTQEVAIAGLDRELDGLRIGHLSDPHVAWWNAKGEFKRTGDLIAGLRPDLLLITGDMVDHHPDYVHAFADCLEKVQPRLGRYAIIGNHDVYTGREAVARRMEARGFRMLRNQSVSLLEKGARLCLAGYDDSGKSWTGGDPAVDRIPEAVAGCDPGLPIILLSHRPPRLKKIERSRVSLVLAGHTHGGQFRLPFGGPGLADMTFEHSSGPRQSGDKTLYVSHGAGTVGWPFRLFCPPDVTLIILRPFEVSGEQ